MMQEPILGELEINDLRQRYSDSYLCYDGTIQRCDGFDCSNNGTLIIYLSNKNNAPTPTTFDWRLVDIRWPVARWYLYQTKDETVPFYLSHRTQRQYCRGMNDQTIRLFWPRGNNNNMYSRVLTQAWSTPRELFRKPTYTGALTNVATYLFSPYICLVGDAVYYKTTIIAHLDREKETFQMRISVFEQELREVVSNPHILPVQQPSVLEKALPRPPRRAPRALIERGGAVAPAPPLVDDFAGIPQEWQNVLDENIRLAGRVPLNFAGGAIGRRVQGLPLEDVEVEPNAPF